MACDLAEQMSLNAATLGLICAARGMRRALRELEIGRANDARYALAAALSGADEAIEQLDALIPGAASLREIHHKQRGNT